MKVDPDSFCLSNSIDDYRAVIAARLPQAIYRGSMLLDGITPDSPCAIRQDVVEKILSFGAKLQNSNDALDREDLLSMTARCTGYTPETLAKIIEDREVHQRQERMEANFDRLLREAQDSRKKRDDITVIQNRLSDGLHSFEVLAPPNPPAFSVDRIKKALANKPAGKPTGWETVDKSEEDGGLGIRLRPDELTTVVGRAAHGKTAAMASLLTNALQAKTTDPAEMFLVYSFEEPEEFITARLVSIQTAQAGNEDCWSTVDVREFVRDPYSRKFWPNPRILENAWNLLKGYEQRLQIVFCPGWTVTDLETHARLVGKEKPIGAIFVDYWQKVPPPGEGGMSGGEDRRDIALAVIGRRFKALAVDLHCPVIVGAQAGRSTARQGSKRFPEGSLEDEEVQNAIQAHRFGMEDIREGGIEQEVDLAIGLLNYRADYRDSAENGYEMPTVSRYDVGAIKNRYGSTGRWVTLAFHARCQHIRDPHPDDGK
jgi:replicative DNA helicase